MDIITKCQQLIEIDSPSGFNNEIQEYLISFAIRNNLQYELTNKGNVLINVIIDEKKPKKLIATHVDTLGLMVRSINNDGTLNITPIGGPIASTLNGEYAKVYTRNGNTVDGTIILNSNASHVYADSNKQVEFKDLRIRLDADVSSKEEVTKLKIATGDYVCYDPKFRVSEDFINSRFLDDKLCAAISLQLLEEYVASKITFKESLCFAFTTFEEVGHGLSYVPSHVEHVIAMDMGCVGDDLAGSERKVSICVKDSSGPYDYNTITTLVNISEELNLPYALDVYPFYGSDASAALRGGNDIKATLIGPGIAASHGMERAHIDGINATYQLLLKYLT